MDSGDDSNRVAPAPGTAETANQLRIASLSLLNAALMSQEPVAQMVLAISAVELLGQREKWSEGQRRLLERFATAAGRDTSLSEIERAEVAAAISGAYKRGLSEGVRLLLD
jgi:hypothetical protein